MPSILISVSDDGQVMVSPAPDAAPASGGQPFPDLESALDAVPGMLGIDLPDTDGDVAPAQAQGAPSAAGPAAGAPAAEPSMDDAMAAGFAGARNPMQKY